MWEYRNHILHKGYVGLHSIERDAIYQAIWVEFIIGKDELPSEYLDLFRGSIQKLVQGSVHSQTK